MKHTSTDLRVKRTLRAIREAFYSLVLEKDYPDISITELTERAEVNRKTFYLHYTSLDDLLNEIEQETANEILFSLSEEATSLDVGGCVSKFYHYLANASDVYQKMLCDPNYQRFYEDVTNRILSSSYFQHFYAITEYPYVVRAFCISITSIYRSWIKNGRDIPLDELIRYANSLIQRGYDSVPKLTPVNEPAK